MLHYTTYPCKPDSPWVTFVHGAGGSSTIWFKQIRAFQAHFNVLMVDLRGHGKSKGGVYEKLKSYSFDTIGDEIVEVVDHLKIKSSHFVGISLGTIIIREIAERYPQKVQKMVLGGAVMKLNARGQVLMRVGAALKSVIPYLLLYKLFAFIIMPRKSHRDSRNLFVREAKKLYQKEFKRWFTLVSQVNPLLKYFRIHEGSHSSLYIMGEEDHMFLPSIQKLVEDHQLATLAVIPECGHVVNVERPNDFNPLAVNYLLASAEMNV